MRLSMRTCCTRLTMQAAAAASCRSAAPALLLKGLAVVLPEQLQQLQQPGAAELPATPAMLAELREAALAELAGRPLPVAQQQLPLDMDRAAPLYWPTEKVRSWHMGVHAHAARFTRQRSAANKCDATEN